MKRLFEDFLRSIFRTVVNMPLIFFWWSLTTMLLMGTERWLDWMHGYLLVDQNLYTAAAYLALVSWAYSLVFTPLKIGSTHYLPAVHPFNPATDSEGYAAN